MIAWVNLLKNNSFAEISQISHVDLNHLLERSTMQSYSFLEKQVKLMGNHPRVQVCWTLEKTTHCFKKQTQESCLGGPGDLHIVILEI